ncbi:hypothetical protein FR483_n656R [Paramecium bursaria Chlorella virus FR483]|uniref:Uncharacterized protein n656R n=1 Tax=Paramecium bursaria Chlorella virus FR483 TaxID=399781 RepID=A7J810_PBCVF|nr:hypothetical protein FR483_n656R [Paramecium bursaria Chlorella virus FR483]ABT15941.1 hypothetical protein FR483_n656R [Paramecium bursaria Chlorella virus FR483]
MLFRCLTAEIISSSTSSTMFLHFSTRSFLIAQRKKFSCPTVVENSLPLSSVNMTRAPRQNGSKYRLE